MLVRDEIEGKSRNLRPDAIRCAEELTLDHVFLSSQGKLSAPRSLIGMYRYLLSPYLAMPDAHMNCPFQPVLVPE